MLVPALIGGLAPAGAPRSDPVRYPARAHPLRRGQWRALNSRGSHRPGQTPVTPSLSGLSDYMEITNNHTGNQRPQPYTYFRHQTGLAWFQRKRLRRSRGAPDKAGQVGLPPERSVSFAMATLTWTQCTCRFTPGVTRAYRLGRPPRKNWDVPRGITRYSCDVAGMAPEALPPVGSESPAGKRLGHSYG